MKRFAGLFSTIVSAKTIALAGLVIMSASANAEDRMTFREFRQQNEGIDRSAARQMFHAQFGRGGGGANASGVSLANPVQHVITVGPDGQAVCGGIINGGRRNHENRVRNQSFQELTSGAIARVNKGVELDLGSATKNIVLGRNLFGANETVQVSIGGKTETFSAGSQVTAAEYVAVKQVLSGGGQQVQVDRSGRAEGGSVDLGSLTANNDVMRASSLIVPKDVTTYGDFGRGSDFRLSGDLTNFGTVQTLSSNANVRGGGIHADNITNSAGALINATGDLSLNAAKNLSNFGTISASGNLALSAGGAVKNAGTVSSTGDLTVTSATVVNRGTLASTSGNVNFATAGGDLVVDNRRGTVSAANAINVRDAAYTGTGNALVVGGDLLSRELNLNSGLGTVNVNVGELSGTVNETGSAAHVWADTSNLNIGSVCLTGDPTFFNSAGAINIAGNILVSEDLTIIAAGDITTANNLTIQAGDATRGYNVTFIAGASFTTSGGSNQGTLGPITGSPPYANAGTVTLNGKSSKTGGSITFGTGTQVSSETTDVMSPGNRNAGNIELFAFAGKDNGFIDTVGAALTAAGLNNGDNGNVTIVADGGIKNFTDATIKIGTIINNGDGAVGDVLIATSAPTILFGKTVTYNANGSRSGESYLYADTKLTKTGFINTVAAGKSIQAGRNVTLFSGGLTQPGVISGELVIVYAGTQLLEGIEAPTLLSGNQVNLVTGKKGFIGEYAPSQGIFRPIVVDAAKILVSTVGGNAFVESHHASTEITALDSNYMLLDAFGTNVEGTINAGTYARVDANQITATVTSGDAIALHSATNLTDNGTHFIGQRLYLDAANVGTSATPMILNSAVKLVNVIAGNAYINVAPGGKAIDLNGANITGDFFFNAPASVNVTGNVSGNDVRLKNASGEFVIHNGRDIQGNLNVLVQNTGATKKDKLTIGNGVAIETNNGTITVMLGESSASVPAVPANVTTEGDVILRGQGFTAKAPINTLDAGSSTITVSNSLSAKNMNLLGNVVIVNQAF